jgi:CRISPR-associated protein Cas2
MSLSARRVWLVSYDISDAKRLARVHRFLKKEALALQYSVFLASASEGGLRWLLHRLGQLIDPRRDDVRAYPIPERCEAVTLGRQIVPSGVFLVDPWLTRILNNRSELIESHTVLHD